MARDTKLIVEDYIHAVRLADGAEIQGITVNAAIASILEKPGNLRLVITNYSKSI